MVPPQSLPSPTPFSSSFGTPKKLFLLLLGNFLGASVRTRRRTRGPPRPDRRDCSSRRAPAGPFRSRHSRQTPLVDIRAEALCWKVDSGLTCSGPSGCAPNWRGPPTKRWGRRPLWSTDGKTGVRPSTGRSSPPLGSPSRRFLVQTTDAPRSGRQYGVLGARVVQPAVGVGAPGELAAVAHHAAIVGLAVDVVTAPVPQPRVWPTVHQGARLLVGGAPVVADPPTAVAVKLPSVMAALPPTSAQPELLEPPWLRPTCLWAKRTSGTPDASHSGC